MTFTSLWFFAFLIGVFAAYASTPSKWRPAVLLLASLVLYGTFNLRYVPLILVLAAVTYLAARGIVDAKSESIRKKALLVGLVFNLCILFVLKYLDFTIDSLAVLLSIPVRHHFKILLPVGISFHVFQAIAYLVDVYRDGRGMERDPVRFGLFITFFPQLMAGPIERGRHLLPQIQGKFTFDEAETRRALLMMLWGLILKMVIADRLAVYVDAVYADPDHHFGLSVLLAIYFFAFQIYCDFAGYCYIALGSAALFGVKLAQNFQQPYLSSSMQEFWRRWHITLGSWFRDYVYIPLGGNRVPPWRRYINLMIVFTLSGLWHGASWTFVIWGALHGFFMIVDVMTQSWRKRFTSAMDNGPFFRIVWHVLAILLTFHLACFAWVFFRAVSLGDALTMIRHAFVFSGDAIIFTGGLRIEDLVFSAVTLAALIVVEGVRQHHDVIKRILTLHVLARWPIYIAAAYAVLLLPGGTELTNFIYFRF